LNREPNTIVNPTLDVICIGRSSVDLYGQQIGGRLEDMASFSKAVGGCPANIAIGTARLGLKSGLITRVGDEHMGRFIREQMQREGVATTGIHTDPDRLTALVLLGVSDDKTFPLIFMRENCADAALDESDIDESFVASAGAVVVTGTHFARANTAAAQHKAIRIARQHGRKVVFDIDYRPNLWGLAGHGAGEQRYVRSQTVTAQLQRILPDCDLIVGTEEELHIAGGSQDTLETLRTIRRLSPNALIVCKRGPMGCVAFRDAIPDSIEKGVIGPGFPVDVYNVLGAGDAFMSGFLRGWLRGETLVMSCTYANACGAFAVSRLLCSPESPSFAELQHFLSNGSTQRQLRYDQALNHIHHATTRSPAPATLRILSIDHGAHDLVPLAQAAGADPARISRFKSLAVQACARTANGLDGFGMFLEGGMGRQALVDATASGLWIARQFPQGDPVAFAENPIEWPLDQVVKLIANESEDARTPLADHHAGILQVMAICRSTRREVLIEALPRHGSTAAALIAQLYGTGLKPDYWLIEGQSSAENWRSLQEVISDEDPFCRGMIVIIRAAMSNEEIAAAAGQPGVIGFVGGRSIFDDVMRKWLSGLIADDTAVQSMADRFTGFAKFFDAGRVK
jgi:5-dehydro-2-deoxygluconokinase